MVIITMVIITMVFITMQVSRPQEENSIWQLVESADPPIMLAVFDRWTGYMLAVLSAPGRPIRAN